MACAVAANCKAKRMSVGQAAKRLWGAFRRRATAEVMRRVERITVHAPAHHAWRRAKAVLDP
jgi:hypothetical protein